MSKHIKAVYPGAFDPITNGHLDIISRATKLFTELILAVYQNPDKPALFSLGERIEMIQQSLLPAYKQQVSVDSFSGQLLVEYCRANKVNVIVRGLRAITDFEYEFQMDHINQLLNKDIETVFFMTSHQYSYLSSSMVKEIAKLNGEIRHFAPEPVVKKINKIYQKGVLNYA